jgi:hypothetical protein
MDTPRKPLWPKIVATVVLLTPILYVASFGPACWITARLNQGTALIGVRMAFDDKPTTIQWYAYVLAPDGWNVGYFNGPDGGKHYCWWHW